MTFLSGTLAAMNPDIEGKVSAGGQRGSAFPGQKATLTGFGTLLFTGDDSFEVGGNWTQPLVERLSLLATADTGADTSEIIFHGTGISADYVDRVTGNYYVLGSGLRFYTGHGFEPWVDANPDGKSGWPVLQVLYQLLERAERTDTVSATGFLAGAGHSELATEAQALGYSLLLPLGSFLTLDLDYSHEIKVRTFYRTGIFNTDVESNGDHEGFGGGFDYYYQVLDRQRSDNGSPYLPHGGFPGQLKLSPRYSQTYDLRRQKFSDRSYSLDGTFILANGLGLSLGWQIVDYGLGGPFHNMNGVTVDDNAWGQSWNASVSYGWGKVQTPLIDGQPAASTIKDSKPGSPR
jgi:hypothetical protein